MSDFKRKKPELPDDYFRLPEAPDEFALAPEEPPPVKPVEVPPVVDAEEPEVKYEDRQFTLGESLGLVAVFAVSLSVLSSVARWMGWANSPASLAAVFALAFGVGTFFGLIFVAGAPNARPIARVSVWVLLGGYILCAACAALLPK